MLPDTSVCFEGMLGKSVAGGGVVVAVSPAFAQGGQGNIQIEDITCQTM